MYKEKRFSKMMKLLSSVFDFAGHYQVLTGFLLLTFSEIEVQGGTQALEYLEPQNRIIE